MGIVTNSFIFWADALAKYAIWFLMPYLTNVWELSITHAAAIINVYDGVTNILTVLLMCIGDVPSMALWTIVHSVQLYGIGFMFLFMSAPPVLSHSTHTCNRYEAECIGTTQKRLLYGGLICMGIGRAGQMISIRLFFISMFKLESLWSKSDFRILNFYMVGLIIQIAGGVGLMYIEPWTIRFGIPAFFIILVSIIFWCGLCGAGEAMQLLPDFELEAQGIDQAINEEDPDKSASYKSGLIICTVILLFIVNALVAAIGNTYFPEQADSMNAKLGKWKVPAVILLAIQTWSKLFFEWGYNKIGRPSVVGIAVALTLSGLCCVTAAEVEKKRLGVPEGQNPISMFWLVPQFVLLGGFESIFEECFKDIVVNYDNVVRGLSGVGILLSVLTVHVTKKASGNGGKKSWFQFSLDESRLDKYYWMLAGWSAVSLAIYILVVVVHKVTPKKPRDESTQRPQLDRIQVDLSENDRWILKEMSRLMFKIL